MIAEIVLTNLGALILYSLAMIGVWHLLGIPPVKEWFKKDEEN